MEEFKQILDGRLKIYAVQQAHLFEQFKQTVDPIYKRIGELYIVATTSPNEQEKRAAHYELMAKQQHYKQAQNVYWGTLNMLSDVTAQNAIDMFQQTREDLNSASDVRLLKTIFLVAIYTVRLYPTRQYQEKLNEVFLSEN